LQLKNQLQKTIKREVSTEGVGLFTGQKVLLKFCPAEEDCGIVFQRIDLPNQPYVRASLDNVKDTFRCTHLMENGAGVQTVEHLLSALYCYGIDNLLIQISAEEVPIGDGSGKIFVDLLEKADVLEQKKPKKNFQLKAPIFFSRQEIHLMAFPSDSYQISYVIQFPQAKFVSSQSLSLIINKENYKKELSSARTFSFYEEVKMLQKKGLLKEANLDQGVIIQGEKVLNPEGFRFSDEMVRHKILDLIGDFSLMGIKIPMHIIAIRSGHTWNVEFAKKLLSSLSIFS
jgi:UDP-3-O-[3-hydroxymyristoyl] N-acetylglucosamine deacetylase